MQKQISAFIQSEEPLVRLKAGLLAGEPFPPDALAQVKDSPLVSTLLSERGADGRIPYHPYGKWYGAHWILAVLSELDYPAGDERLIPLRDQQLEWLLSNEHLSSVRVLNGRPRRCASQEGYALYAQIKLGIADDRIEKLARGLIGWQWPDGGWNCDKNPEASHSSFHESWMPLRALTLYAQTTGDSTAQSAAERAAEFFLSHRLFGRVSNGNIIKSQFTILHYPWYWHYDILAGLKAMMESGLLSDPRCQEALDLLASKQLSDGGFPLQSSYCPKKNSPRRLTGTSLVQFGPVSRRQSNPYVTLEALEILGRTGRI